MITGSPYLSYRNLVHDAHLLCVAVITGIFQFILCPLLKFKYILRSIFQVYGYGEYHGVMGVCWAVPCKGWGGRGPAGR